MPKRKADLVGFYFSLDICTELMPEAVSANSGQPCPLRRKAEPFFKCPVLASILDNHFIPFGGKLMQKLRMNYFTQNGVCVYEQYALRLPRPSQIRHFGSLNRKLKECP